MYKKILWIDDDYYHLRGIFRPLELAGIIIDPALSASEGYRKAKNWKDYNLIATDLILSLSKDSNPISDEVKKWEKEKYLGIGLLKWLIIEQKAQCPIVILSVIDDPIATYNLQDLSIKDYISKRGLLPSMLAKKINTLINPYDA